MLHPCSVVINHSNDEVMLLKRFFNGFKIKKKQAKQISKFSIYLSVLFITLVITAYIFDHPPQKIVLIYLGLSFITFLAYTFDKSKA